MLSKVFCFQDYYVLHLYLLIGFYWIPVCRSILRSTSKSEGRGSCVVVKYDQGPCRFRKGFNWSRAGGLPNHVSCQLIVKIELSLRIQRQGFEIRFQDYVLHSYLLIGFYWIPVCWSILRSTSKSEVCGSCVVVKYNQGPCRFRKRFYWSRAGGLPNHVSYYLIAKIELSLRIQRQGFKIRFQDYVLH